MLFRSSKRAEDYWISVSDLMAGLMMVFLLIAVSYMVQVRKQFEIWVYLEKEYVEVQEAIYKELESEFKEDLKIWEADIDKKTLAVIFHSPEVMFEKNEDLISVQYKEILDDFFPRYIEALERAKYQINGQWVKAKKNISQIRIEGHASHEWTRGTPEKIRFLKNMDLSQRRSQSVLDYVLRETEIGDDYDWVKDNIIGVGYSSAKPVFDSFDLYDRESSRRVEFKVVLDAQEKLFEIIQQRRSGGRSSSTDAYFETKPTVEETRRYEEKNKESLDLDEKLSEQQDLLKEIENLKKEKSNLNDNIDDAKNELERIERDFKNNIQSNKAVLKLLEDRKEKLSEEVRMLSEESEEEAKESKPSNEDIEKEDDDTIHIIAYDEVTYSFETLEDIASLYNVYISQIKDWNPQIRYTPKSQAILFEGDSIKIKEVNTRKIPDTPPKIIQNIQPEYPIMSQKAGIEGTVIIECLIDTKGTVTEVRIIDGLPRTGLDEEAIKAAKKTRFEPGTKNGKKTPMWYKITYRFEL